MTELPDVFMDHAQPYLPEWRAHLITAKEVDSAIAILRCLSAGGAPKHTLVGVCGNLSEAMNGDSWYDLVAMCSRNYPGFSGDPSYPLLGGKSDYLAEELWVGRLGDERRRFCAWLADYLERVWVPSFDMAKCDWED